MRVTIYRRGRIWWVRYADQGRQVRQSLHTDNRKIAEDHRAELEWRVRRGEVPPAERRVTIDRFLEEYEVHSQAHKRPKSHRTDMGRIRAFLGAVPGGALQSVSTADVVGYLAQKALADGSSPATLLRYREALHAFFKHAVRLSYLARNPVATVPRPSLPQRDPRFLSRDQIDELLEELGEDPLKPIAATAIYAGLRRGELCWLTWKDVSSEGKRMVLRVRSKTVKGEHWHPKTGRNRNVPVSTRLQPILEACRSSKSPWIFPSPKGYRWDPDNLSARVRCLLTRAGLPWTFLDLRHTFGSQLARKGMSLLKIAALMGNSPEIARRHYIHLLPEELHAEIEF